MLFLLKWCLCYRKDPPKSALSDFLQPLVVLHVVDVGRFEIVHVLLQLAGHLKMVRFYHKVGNPAIFIKEIATLSKW